MELEDRLRAILHTAGEAIAVDDRPETAEMPATSDSRPRRWSSQLAFAVAFVAVLAGGALTAALLRGDGGVNGVTSPLTTPAPSLRIDDSQHLAWDAVAGLPGNVWVAALAHGPNGWLMLAPRNDVTNGWPDAIALTSSDGTEWFELESAGFEGVVHIDGVVADGSEYLAYGLYASPGYTMTTVGAPSNFPEPAVWSTTDGVSWIRLPLPLPNAVDAISDSVSYFVSAAAVTGGQAVAIGVELDGNVPEGLGANGPTSYVLPSRSIMWERDAAGTWELLEAPGSGEVQGTAAGPAGIVVADSDGTTTRFWVRDTGDWQEGGTVPGAVARLVAGGAGYVAATDAGLWFSPDAIGWMRVDDVDAPEQIAAGPGGFVATGTVGTSSSAWWSPDGARWRLVASTEEIDSGMLSNVYRAGAAENAVLLVTIDPADGRSVVLIGSRPAD